MSIRSFNKNRKAKKVTALVILTAFIISCHVSDSWSAVDIGGPPVESSRDLDPEQKYLNIDTFAIPPHLGEIKYSYKGEGGKLVVHLQDAHSNWFAQEKISGIIDYLNTEYGINMINLEGGAGDYDLSVFTSIGGEAIRAEVAEHFVKKGEINGAEFYAINNPGNVTLWGVEDEELYLKNLKVYRESLTHKKDVDMFLDKLSRILNQLKRHIYTPELLKIDMAYNAYKAGNKEFKQYLEFMYISSSEEGIEIKKYPNLYQLKQSIDMEKIVDFKKANRERTELINALKKRLSRDEVRELVAKTIDFKTKRVSMKAFYGYLLKKAKEIHIDTAPFKALSDYIVYASTYEEVNRSMVMKEMEDLEMQVRERLFSSEQQRGLDNLSRTLALMKNIFTISLSLTDYEYYIKNKSDFEVRNFLEFIKKEAPVYNIKETPNDDIASLDGYREDITRFYEYSFQRDEAFIRNLRFGKSISGIEDAVLVTGGFHTDNLLSIFEANGISYISILPKFTNKKDYESPYFDLLAGRTEGIQGMLKTVIARATMLQIASKFSDMASVVYDDTDIYSLKAAVIIQGFLKKGHIVVVNPHLAFPDPDQLLVFQPESVEKEAITFELSILLAQAGYPTIFGGAGVIEEDSTLSITRRIPAFLKIPGTDAHKGIDLQRKVIEARATYNTIPVDEMLVIRVNSLLAEMEGVASEPDPKGIYPLAFGRLGEDDVELLTADLGDEVEAMSGMDGKKLVVVLNRNKGISKSFQDDRVAFSHMIRHEYMESKLSIDHRRIKELEYRENGENALTVLNKVALEHMTFEQLDEITEDHALDESGAFYKAAQVKKGGFAANGVMSNLRPDSIRKTIIMPLENSQYNYELSKVRTEETETLRAVRDKYGEGNIQVVYYMRGDLSSLKLAVGLAEKERGFTKDNDARLFAFIDHEVFGEDPAFMNDLSGRAKVAGIVKEEIGVGQWQDISLHVILGLGLIDHKKDPGRIDLMNRIKGLIGVMSGNPDEIEKINAKELIEMLLSGALTIKIRKIDYEEIKYWKDAEDAVRRAL